MNLVIEIAKSLFLNKAILVSGIVSCYCKSRGLYILWRKCIFIAFAKKEIYFCLSVYFLTYCTVFCWVNCVLCIYSNNTCIGAVLLDFYSWPLWNRFRADKVTFLKVLSSLFIYSQELLFTNFSAPSYI